MASNMATRFRGVADPSVTSIYETIREHDAVSDTSDFDDRLDLLESQRLNQPAVVPNTKHARRLSLSPSSAIEYHDELEVGMEDVEDIEDDVPASLLIENHTERPRRLGRRKEIYEATDQDEGEVSPIPRLPRTIPRPSSIDDGLPTHQDQTLPAVKLNDFSNTSPRELAMWRWANVENLDNFLADVYDYYILHGYWSIILRRSLNLITVGFIVGFTLFLTECVNYSQVKNSTRLTDVLVHRCTARMGFTANAVLWISTFIGVCKVFQYVVDLRRLKHLHDFFLYLLNIPEAEIQSISWQEVVSRLMALRDSNPNIRTGLNLKVKRYMGTQSKERMDAHDIANRLMRKDNYMIAMINKEILDTTLPLPLLGSRQLFTKTLEWHLNYCILDYVFDPKGQVRQLFLKDTHRKALSEGLRRRFIFAGTTSLIFAPFLILYFLVQNFFQHFNEYQKDPAQIGSRQYNVYAQWKFREFNELWHLFDRRLKMSHPFALRYINQFPKDKTVQAARFVTFVSGAIVSILGLTTVLDQENFLSFEITSGRTTIFYLGVFGSIWAVARGMLPDDNMVYDSSYSMEEVIEFTHYRPAHWKDRLHTVEVKTEFASLYQMQIVVLIEEALSMIFTPFVLWWALPKCSDRIIDFFREFTVHVDGLGYVCSFAEFNLKKPGQIGTGDNAGTRAANPDPAIAAREDYYSARDNKLEQSYWGFMNDYAQNPKTDVRFPYRNSARRPPNMPPPFPGLLSPTLPHQRVGPDFAASSAVQQHDPNPTTQTEKRGKARMQSSSMLHSILLDAHHQPSHSVFGVAPVATSRRHFNTKSRMLSAQGETLQSTILREEDERPENDGTQVEEAVVGSRGELGSWKYDDNADSGNEEDEDPAALTEAGGGVLGLIHRFQRAHGDDKRSAGV